MVTFSVSTQDIATITIHDVNEKDWDSLSALFTRIAEGSQGSCFYGMLRVGKIALIFFKESKHEK